MNDWVGDPEARREAGLRLSMIHDPPLPANLNDSAIRSILDSLLQPRPDPLAFPKLNKIGKAAVPVLIEALADPRFTTAKTIDKRAGHPLKSVLKVLAEHAEANEATRIAPLIDHPDNVVKRWAVLALARIGAAQSVKPLLRVLSGPDEELQRTAWTGIELACERGKASPEFRNAIFDFLVAGSEMGTLPDHPKRLLLLSEQRAMELLLSPEFLSPEMDGVLDCVAALAAYGIGVSPELLDQLLIQGECMIDKEDDFYRGATLASLLPAIAMSRLLDAEQRLCKFLDHRCIRVQEAAASTLLLLAGVPDPRRLTRDLEKRIGWKRLPVEVQRYDAMQDFVTFLPVEFRTFRAPFDDV